MPTVNIYEAKTQLSKLVDMAASGSDVVIARNGKPVARLTAAEKGLTSEIADKRAKRMEALGSLEGQGWIADDFDGPLPLELLAGFEKDF
jgi:prevent-host-death family protein